MPRGQKSKLRAREKRRQAKDETQGLKNAQAAEEKGAPSCSSSVSEDAVPSTSAAAFSQKPTTTAAAGVSQKKSGKGAKSRGEGSASTSKIPPSTESAQRDLLTKKAGMLMQYLLYKYKMKEPIMKGEMLKIVNKRFNKSFPEILKKASEHVDLVFGLELKEVKPGGNSYTLVSKLDVTNNGSLTSLGFPKNGLLMPLLGAIFLNGNSASEEEIWEFLNILGIYEGKRHIIFGESRKLITQDLVQEQYLEYRQVPGSDPPHYQFLWGPRSFAETSKMKVLEFLAKVNDTVPSAFPSHYEEALRDEEERSQPRAATRRGAAANIHTCSRVTPGSSSCP
ncbi:melanoma-associated antigen B2-like [Marmota flaviventris]|uniref:melanoma-associated antigen B2-like n=1 Tax=Marmota flaviventris TaxID=93162 RepID=UPI000FFF7BF0|nr:melanoma-associated antigen B2-like [Marmota flaviventris]